MAAVVEVLAFVYFSLKCLATDIILENWNFRSVLSKLIALSFYYSVEWYGIILI